MMKKECPTEKEQDMEKYIIALDQGTTSSRCIVFDREERLSLIHI